MIFSKVFFLDALTRAFRTFVQSLVAVLGVGQLDVFHANWTNALSISLGSAVVSFLMALDRANPNASMPNLPNMLPEIVKKAQSPNVSVSPTARAEKDFALPHHSPHPES